jgi:O-antigen ligase
MSMTGTRIASKPNAFEKLYFCFFLLLPLVYVDKLVDPVLIPRQIFLTVFVCITSIVICYQVYSKKLVADFSFLKFPVFLCCFLFIIILLISFFQSIAITESIYVLSKISIEILFFINTSFLLIQNKLRLEYLIKTVIIFSLVVVTISIFQLLKLTSSGTDFFEVILTVNATFGHKNLLASILFLTFPFLFNSMSFSKPWKILSIILTVFILILIWLVQTKAVILAFFVFSSILAFLFLRNKQHNVNKGFLKTAIMSVSLLIIVVSIFTIRNKEKFTRIFDKTSSVERFFVWDNSVQLVKEHFITGVGAGNWQVHFPKYGLDKFPNGEIRIGMTTFQRPHNDFLWVLCEMGIIGLIAYILIFSIVLYYLFILIKKDEKQSWLYSTFIAGIVGYIVIAFVDFPLERIEHQLLLYLMFSIIIAHYYKSFQVSESAQKIIIKFPIVFILLFTPVLFSFIVSFKRYSGEYHTQKMYHFEQTSNWAQMIKEADKARNNCYSIDPTSVPIEWYKGVALFSSGDINTAKYSFEQAYSIHPYNIHVMNNLASCFESLKEHKKAEEFYLKALSISPEFEEARLNLSAVYFNNKEYEKAFETIEKVDIYTTDEKYKVFLPAILNSWVDGLLSKQKDPDLIKRIMAIKNTNDKLRILYVESKEKGVNFVEYILK